MEVVVEAVLSFFYTLFKFLRAVLVEEFIGILTGSDAYSLRRYADIREHPEQRGRL